MSPPDASFISPRSVVVVPVDGRVSDVTWGDEELIIVVSDPEEIPGRTRLDTIDLATLREAEVSLELGGCDDDMFVSPRFEEGVLRFARICYPNVSIALMERSASGDVRTLVEDLGFPPDGYVSPDDGATWIASDASGFCSWITRAHGSGGPWPIVVEGGSRSFQTDEGLVEEDCDRTGQASWITKGPDGQLAFLAAPAAVDLSGSARFDMPWNVYLLDADGKARLLAAGFVRPSDLHWTPTGDSISVTGTWNGRKGLWSIATTGAVSPLIEGAILSFSWEPTGRRLAIIEPVGSVADRTYRLSIVEPGA